MRRALDSERYVKANEVPTRLTDKKHIPFFRPKDYRSVTPRINIDYMTTMRNDGNNIDIEHEISSQLKNQMRYQALSQQMNNQFRRMNIVMRAP